MKRNFSKSNMYVSHVRQFHGYFVYGKDDVSHARQSLNFFDIFCVPMVKLINFSRSNMYVSHRVHHKRFYAKVDCSVLKVREKF